MKKKECHVLDICILKIVKILFKYYRYNEQKEVRSENKS